MKLYESHGFSRRWLGVGMALLAAAAASAQTQVTFVIDMSTESGTPNSVWIAGSFNGWPGPGAATNAMNLTPTNALINIGGTIWSNTFLISDPAGTVESCKFQDDISGYEPLAANRQFVLAAGSQVLPLTMWNANTTWPPPPTNSVTFQIDMTVQIAVGNFTNGVNGQPGAGDSITVSGSFEGWDAGLPLTNNPSLPGVASNIYSAALPVPFFPPSLAINYKFRMNGGYESPASTGGNNRTATVTNNEVLPLVYYNDTSPSDVALQPIAVTFSLYITNGTLDDKAYAFQKGVDQIFLNADFLGWWAWGLDAGPAADQMIEVGNSDVYTNTLVIPKGNSIVLTYKYGLDGFDDENGFATNHIRLIRNYGPAYSMPQDVWSFTYNPGADTTTNIVEQSFGNLKIGAPVGGSYPITWLGRPGVVLQNSSTPSKGYTDNGGTDATMSTNWPSSGGNQFFRLKQRP